MNSGQSRIVVKVYPNLYVGNQAAYERRTRNSPCAFVQACKEPYHCLALGYHGRRAPSGHSEHHFAYRRDPDRIILNLIDADHPKYIQQYCIDSALSFISHHIQRQPVLVHGIQGRSRSPSIALLWLHYHTNSLPDNLAAAIVHFTRIYPPFLPADGMLGYLIDHWNHTAP